MPNQEDGLLTTVNTRDLAGMDPLARRFLAMVNLAAPKDHSAVSVADRRRSFEKLMRFSKGAERGVDAIDLTIPRIGGTIPLRLYSAGQTPDLAAGLVYFHGGGFVAGSLDTHDALCRSLAKGASCRVVAVGYRLAPEHPFPAAILDAITVVRWILKHGATCGMDREAIAVGGDSGGATLATIVAQVFRGRAALKAQVLLCPVLDFSTTNASRRAFASGFLLDAATMAQDLQHYAPSRPLDDPRISPLHADDLAGMPPSVIHTAAFDPLIDEGVDYAGRLAEAGVPVRYRCHETLVHHFYGLNGIIPAAQSALMQIAEDIRDVLS